jgi:hypothetical protein
MFLSLFDHVMASYIATSVVVGTSYITHISIVTYICALPYMLTSILGVSSDMLQHNIIDPYTQKLRQYHVLRQSGRQQIK